MQAERLCDAVDLGELANTMRKARYHADDGVNAAVLAHAAAALNVHRPAWAADESQVLPG